MNTLVGSSVDSRPERTWSRDIDDDGMEYEFIQYTSDDPAERNDYDL